MFVIKNMKYKNILDISDLKIEKNGITSIVGKSGSGKTTFLKLLNKMISPSSGDIYYNDINLNDINSISLRRKVVMLNQTPAIYGGNIRENLLIGRRFSEKEILPDEKLKEILDELELNKSLDISSEELSGGERQRIALGRVILTDPEVFLLDEPSSALDSVTENLIINSLVKHTKEKNKTLIMVTHSREIGEKFSDMMVEIENQNAINKKGLR